MGRKFDGAYAIKEMARNIADAVGGSLYEGEIVGGRTMYFVLREEAWPGELDDIHWEAINIVRSLRKVKEDKK